uniref:Short-chain dehydrogenase/reductase n=1 Tax=Ectopseudomonas oleovorans TaxID=301 RepID=A0A653BCY7_ECTOL
MQRTPRSISDYDASFDPVRKGRVEKSGHQLGDPQKAARAMLTIIDSPAPPAHLLLGATLWPWCVTSCRARSSIEQWEALSRSTDG